VDCVDKPGQSGWTISRHYSAWNSSYGRLRQLRFFLTSLTRLYFLGSNGHSRLLRCSKVEVLKLERRFDQGATEEDVGSLLPGLISFKHKTVEHLRCRGQKGIRLA
jgi:hypothetical protein